MTGLKEAVDSVLRAQLASGKPLAIIVAGHNGSGKSTMWNERLGPALEIPLINADRMMRSILPEPKPKSGKLPKWAQTLQDKNSSWMEIAQKGVEAFVVQAMSRKVPFAMETVFSHWRDREDGTFESKIDRIVDLQMAGYFVLLLFVGLSDAQLSIGRVATRVTQGGHNVDESKLISRFPKTQRAISAALPIADASILMDNSREKAEAFTVCRVQLKDEEVYDLRIAVEFVPLEIAAWLDKITPIAA